MKIWEKKDEPRTLASKYGKSLVSQTYSNPVTGQDEEFVLFGQKDWSVVFALTPDNQVVVIRQYKQGCDKIIDELPAGAADFTNESPETTARRELKEETGYESQSITLLGAYWIATRSSRTRFHCFLATNCVRTGDIKQDPSEQIEMRLIPLREWLDLVLSSAIDEPSSVIATFRALSHIGITLKFPN